jgi:uncharacterized membrane protein required for colicin V production
VQLEGLYAELVAAFVLLFMLAVTVLVINPYVRARLPSMVRDLCIYFYFRVTIVFYGLLVEIARCRVGSLSCEYNRRRTVNQTRQQWKYRLY